MKAGQTVFLPLCGKTLDIGYLLEQGYRVAAFLSLGGILLIGGLLYQRYAQQIRGFLLEDGSEATEA